MGKGGKGALDRRPRLREPRCWKPRGTSSQLERPRLALAWCVGGGVRGEGESQLGRGLSDLEQSGGTGGVYCGAGAQI